ncbi:unnamed protein product [Arabidopsis halleri]
MEFVRLQFMLDGEQFCLKQAKNTLLKQKLSFFCFIMKKAKKLSLCSDKSTIKKRKAPHISLYLPDCPFFGKNQAKKKKKKIQQRTSFGICKI